MKKQGELLQEKYSKIVKMTNINKDNHIITAELRMKTSFRELMRFTTDESTLKDPYEIVSRLMEKYNEYFKELSYIDADWLIDELTLMSFTQDKEDVLYGFMRNTFATLTKIKEKLDRAKRYCEGLRLYITGYVKSDIVWRNEMSNLMKELSDCPKGLPNPVRPCKRVPCDSINWETIEKLMELSQRYTIYHEKVQSSIDNVKNLIDVSVKK